MGGRKRVIVEDCGTNALHDPPGKAQVGDDVELLFYYPAVVLHPPRLEVAHVPRRVCPFNR